MLANVSLYQGLIQVSFVHWDASFLCSGSKFRGHWRSLLLSYFVFVEAEVRVRSLMLGGVIEWCVWSNLVSLDVFLWKVCGVLRWSVLHLFDLLPAMRLFDFGLVVQRLYTSIDVDDARWLDWPWWLKLISIGLRHCARGVGFWLDSIGCRWLYVLINLNELRVSEIDLSRHSQVAWYLLLYFWPWDVLILLFCLSLRIETASVLENKPFRAAILRRYERAAGFGAASFGNGVYALVARPADGLW